MARIGFKTAKYNKIVNNTYATLTNNAVPVFEKVVDEKFAPEYNSAELYANDGIAESDYSFKKGTLSLTVADDNDKLCAELLGNTDNTQPVDAQQEWQRLAPALCAIRHHWPHIPISVDTFRATIAEQAILAGADIINDVYGGQSDEKMWDIIAQHQVPYVLTYSATIAPDQHTMSQVMDFMQRSLDCLRKKGVADVIVDPGFGFGKSVEQNYTILQQLHLLEALHAPVLVGVSRKSMLYKPLGIRPQDALPATIAAQTLALERGANVLRVHDVAAAKHAIRIYHLTHSL